MLSSWSIPFEGVDVEAEPARQADLDRLGIPRVPATVIGERFVHGWNPEALADLVGVRHVAGERLAPAELARRLDRILGATERAIQQVPLAALGMQSPGRRRSVRELAFHVFRLSAAFPDTREQGYFPDAWLGELPPDELADGASIAAYGQGVRVRLRTLTAAPGWCDGRVRTYYGEQTAHELLERTTWHAAQHLRQLYWFLEQLTIRPAARLDDAEFAGLPLPKEVWS